MYISNQRVPRNRLITSMVLTKYSDETDIKDVNINNHVIDSHFDISGASSSSEISEVGLS